MSWEAIIDDMKEWVIAQAYATEAWVLAKAYSTIAYVDAEITTLKNWVIAQNYLDQAFSNRGDPGVPDWQKINFTTDGAWHTLDISAETAVGTKAVLVRILTRANAVNRTAFFRTPGNANVPNSSQVQTEVANVTHRQDIIWIPNANREIEYKFDNVVWTYIAVTVAGRWY